MSVIGEKFYLPIEEAAKVLCREEQELRDMRRAGILPGKYKAGVFCVNLKVLAGELGIEYDNTPLLMHTEDFIRTRNGKKEDG